MCGKMNRQTERCTEGRARWKDGLDRQKATGAYRQTVEFMDGWWTDWQMDGGTDGDVFKLTDRQVERFADGQMGSLVAGRRDKLRNRQTTVYVAGQMNARTDRRLE